MKDKWYFAVVYMFLVTAFFSSIVIGFSRLTRERVEANRQLAFERSVLEVFALAEDKTSAQLHETFVSCIRLADHPEKRIYNYVLGNQIKGYAIVVSGQGFWAQIKGVIGFDTDKKTITGISFYEQNETPGLGGKIAEAQFCDQFSGIRIAETGKPIGIKAIGLELGDNEVYAITGATQTCTRLQKLINDDLVKWTETNNK